MIKLTKLDEFKKWARKKKVYSTTDVKMYGLNNYFTSVDVRCRIDLKDFHRRIPDQEAKDRGLVKDGNRNITWYEVY